MDIKKNILFFHFVVFFFLLTLATESETYSAQIEQQINGTLNVCKDILGKELWKNDTDKPIYDQNIAMFNVCVPKKIAFHEFVDVNDQDEVIGGFSIAIFCLALQELPYKIQHIVFTPLNDQNYTDIVLKLKSNTSKEGCDALAGDFTITSKRTNFAGFTLPYMSSEIYILVPTVRKWNQSFMTLIRPFTVRLWIALVTASILIGVAIGFLEYREENPGFYDVPSYQKLFMVLWFPVSRFFFQEGSIHNKCSKFVLVVWLMTIFIVMQIFTACLSSWLTVNQLQAKVPKQYKVVGYQEASYVVDFVKDHVQNETTAESTRPLYGLEEYKMALDNGTVDAIFDEHPYIDIFLAKYGDIYMKVGPVLDEPGLAFAFPLESPLQQKFSNAVVKVTESKHMADMKEKYLGIKSKVTPQPADYSVPESLDLHSFFFLFLFMSVSTIMAIAISEISRKRKISSNELIEMQDISVSSTENEETVLNNGSFNTRYLNEQRAGNLVLPRY